MSTFQELTGGTGPSALRVKKFFEDIRNTFSISAGLLEETYISSNREYPDQSSSESSYSPSTITEQRSAPVPSSNSSSLCKRRSLNLIAVVHLLPTLPAYLRALQLVGNIKVIIFKGAAKDKRPKHMSEMAEWVANDSVFASAVKEVTKSDLKTPENVRKLLSDAADNNTDILIMDIGGYFAHCLEVLCDSGGSYRLLGIVEDTENGHQKYHRALQRLQSTQPNIYSVARSRLKMTEDYNVGKSIVRAADNILRQSLDHRLEDHRVVGVLGFGKIGSSIAMHLRQQHIGTVLVYDVNPEILLRACSFDFVVCTKEEMLQQASFIFCATGNRALTYNDLLNIGMNVKDLIIASCTSADDELDVHERFECNQNKDKSSTEHSFSRYILQRLNGETITITLLCDGNAVNFFHRGVLGESIRSVQAAMIVCALNLQQLSIQNQQIAGINTLTNEEEMRIARLWLQHFSELDVHLITNVSCAHMNFQKTNIEGTIDDLPVDRNSIKEFKKYMNLEEIGSIDPIDFMDSKVKLIITSSSGSGKTAILFSFIQDVRNYYDLIWWFDCSDLLQGALLSLAQEFHVSSVGLSTHELQKAVLEAALSSLAISNILLVIDNVQEFDKEDAFEISANNASDVTNTNSNATRRQFKFHRFLGTLNKILDETPRRQRRCHIVALYTQGSTNQPPLRKPSLSIPKAEESWLYLPLENIVSVEKEKRKINRMLLNHKPQIKDDRMKLINKILSIDTRRLTIQLSVSLLKSNRITDKDLVQLEKAVNESGQDENVDILLHLIQLALKWLEDYNKDIFLCAQVSSLIHSGSISREVFHRIHDILCQVSNTESNNIELSGMDWSSIQENFFQRLKEYCIIRQNFLAPVIYKRTSEHSMPPEYVEVYSMRFSYARELHKPLVVDKTSVAWKCALKLINEGFNYDYYDFNADKGFQHGEQNLVHYLDHATTLIKHTDNWTGDEESASSVGELLCRLGSYYLNERRMYPEATESYFKAQTMFSRIINTSKTNVGETRTSLSISKWSAILMWQICYHFMIDPTMDTHRDFISKIEKTRKELEGYISQDFVGNAKRYQIEATIAISRIRVLIAGNLDVPKDERDQSLMTAKNDLEKIQTKELGARTKSLLWQILGNIYSLLKEYGTAQEYYRNAISLREEMLSSEHVDVARVKYYLAKCLVDSVEAKDHEDYNTKDFKINTLNEAKRLCETAFTIQKTQLPIEHRNIKDCSDLWQLIEKVFKQMEPA